MTSERLRGDAPKVVVITGASGGLGRAMARIYLGRGAIVVGFDLDTAPFAALAAAQGAGVAEGIDLDITNGEAVARAFAQVDERHGRIDVLINNAGITQLGPFSEMPAGVMRKVVEVNFFGAVHCTASALPSLRRSRGSLVAVSSVAGFAPLVRRTAYSASKHAMQGFFGSLRAEEGPKGVHVLIACPSFIATNPGAAMRADGTHRPGAAEDGVAAMDADAAARQIVQAIDRRRDMVLVGRVARISWWLNRISTRLYTRAMMRTIRKR
jgi:NAD(P)-dependent dehydrogenase (short-subunit alcohol dehydrogenase family)